MVERITPEIESMAGGEGSDLSRGGMKTKVDAAKMATGAGAAMVIASGKDLHPLKAIDDGARCTWFAPDGNPATARKRWIAGSLDPHGALVIDEGAVRALKAGKSLLPAGIRSVTGVFERGDAVRITTPDGHEVARGLVAYDSADAQKIAGRKSSEIEVILGYAGRNAMVHRDDMALTGIVSAGAVGFAGATARDQEAVGFAGSDSAKSRSGRLCRSDGANRGGMNMALLDREAVVDVAALMQDMGDRARQAARDIALASTDTKNAALAAIAAGIRARVDDVLAANARDLAGMRQRDVTPAYQERATLNPERVEAIAKAVEDIAALPDPVGDEIAPLGSSERSRHCPCAHAARRHRHHL